MWPGCGRMPERERPKPGWRKPRGLSQSLERNEEEENRGRARTPRGGCPPTPCRAVLPEQAWQRTPPPADGATGRDGPRSGGAGAEGVRLARRRSARVLPNPCGWADWARDEPV